MQEQKLFLPADPDTVCRQLKLNISLAFSWKGWAWPSPLNLSYLPARLLTTLKNLYGCLVGWRDKALLNLTGRFAFKFSGSYISIYICNLTVALTPSRPPGMLGFSSPSQLSSTLTWTWQLPNKPVTNVRVFIRAGTSPAKGKMVTQILSQYSLHVTEL